MRATRGSLVHAAARPEPGTSLEQEKVGVRSIRMRELRRHARAVLGSFFAADRLLLEWSKQSGGVLECEFEIIYSDGYRLVGDYRFKRKGPSRPALTNFVRACAARGCREHDAGAAPDEAMSAHWFLDRYETADCQ